MKYQNKYTPPPRPDRPHNPHEHTPPEEYDVNWSGPSIDILYTDRVELRPVIPSLHAKALLAGTATDPHLFDHIATYACRTLSDVLDWFEYIRSNSGGLYRIIFVSPRILPQPPPDWSRITDPTARPETKDWVVAGITGFSYQSMSDLTGSTGLMLFPFARGTGVSTHSCGLTLRWAMTLPASTSDKVNKDGEGPSDEEPIPLGLRRMQWESSPDNSPSVGLAKRMGYKLEGNRRMCLMLREGQAGNKGREGDAGNGKGSMDYLVFSVTCHDWEGGVKQKVDELLQ